MDATLEYVHGVSTGNIQLKNPSEVIAETSFLADLKASGVVTSVRQFDLTCAFFQHLLPEEARKWCVFSYKGKKYMFLRLPMGSRVAPEIQQRISVALVREALQVEKITPDDPIKITVHRQLSVHWQRVDCSACV